MSRTSEHMISGGATRFMAGGGKDVGMSQEEPFRTRGGGEGAAQIDSIYHDTEQRQTPTPNSSHSGSLKGKFLILFCMINSFNNLSIIYFQIHF